MDERVTRLRTPEECEQFALNVADSFPKLARQARRRAVELRAAAHGATSAAEREALQAVYAYEKVLSETRGKTVRASRTWQMIKRHGIINAVERAVDRKEATAGLRPSSPWGCRISHSKPLCVGIRTSSALVSSSVRKSV